MAWRVARVPLADALQAGQLLGTASGSRIRLHHQRWPDKIVVEVDSNRAPEPDRKSVDGGFSFLGKHQFDSWSTKQRNHALCSAEAEHTAIVNGSAHGMWLKNSSAEMHLPINLEINADSSGAQGFCSRVGCGKVRHPDAEYPWVHSKVRNGVMCIIKVHTQVNRADMHTMPLDRHRFFQPLDLLPLRPPPSGLLGSRHRDGQHG